MKSIVIVVTLLLAGCAAPAGTENGHAEGVGAELQRTCPVPRAARPFEQAAITEASGIARSQREPCVFWVHDDSGADAVIYAVDGAGAHLGEAKLDAPAIDWEDIASFTLDGSPFLLIGDVGNNARLRTAVSFLIVAEPLLPERGTPGSVTVTDVLEIEVRFSGEPLNIESVAVDPATDEILVVSKGAHPIAPADASGPNQALYTASLSEAMAQHVVTLEFRAFLRGIKPGPGDDPANAYVLGISSGQTTAMDLHPDRREVAILTYREILAWERAPTQSWAQAVDAMPRAVAVPDPGKDTMEGLAYSHDGALFLVADEWGETNSELTIVPVAQGG